jgi:tetratricopeptide (TPR) repeat protein
MIELGTPQHFLDMGLRMADSGDIPRARDALLRAVNSGDPEIAPHAAHELGLLMADSDPGTAEAAFRLAIESGNRYYGSHAAFALASLYQQDGHLQGALGMFELAAQSSDDDIAVRAREAAQSLSKVKVGQTADMSPAAAAFTEGCYQRAAGDLAGAIEAFQRCMATGDTEFAPHAGCQLGAILAAEGDYENAKPSLWLAVRSGHNLYSPISAYVLSEILLEEGDQAGARTMLPLAVRHPDPNTARKATAMLADLQTENS